MIEISEEEWRRAFPIWLRTGRLPPYFKDDEIECKFNRWHDRENGRFTFAGKGRYHGGGGGFNGGGATGTWQRSQPKRVPANQKISSATIVPPGQPTRSGFARPVAALEAPFRTVLRNGYTYQIDSRERTRRVSGALTVADAPIRSRTSQRQAGGVERRTSDDGGHYVAARFNGPTKAFNHFAQDANFNRGGYRVLENEWARDKHAGRAVTVKIVPLFAGASVRPSAIDVWWTVDGNEKSLKFLNERSEKSHGK